MLHDLIYCPEDFIANMEHIRLKKGACVIEAGTAPEHVYAVLSGMASTTYVNGEGQSVIASFLIPGDYIGEINLICRQKFLFSSYALSDMELLKIPAGAFVARLKADFRLVESAIQSQNNRINFLESYSLVNQTYSLYERMLIFLNCYLLHVPDLHQGFHYLFYQYRHPLPEPGPEDHAGGGTDRRQKQPGGNFRLRKAARAASKAAYRLSGRAFL